MRWSTRLGFPRVWFSPSVAYALTTGQGLLPCLLRSSGLLRSPPASALLEASLSALGRLAAPSRRRMPGSILPPSSRRIAGRNMFRATRSQRGIVYHSPVPARSGRLVSPGRGIGSSCCRWTSVTTDRTDRGRSWTIRCRQFGVSSSLLLPLHQVGKLDSWEDFQDRQAMTLLTTRSTAGTTEPMSSAPTANGICSLAISPAPRRGILSRSSGTA